MFSLQAALPRAQEREAGRSEPTTDYSHKAVSVISLGHCLPAVTQPVSPKVRSLPQLFVVSLLALLCQVLCKSSCLYNSHSKFRSVYPPGRALWLLIYCEVHLCGFTFWWEIPGPWGEKQQLLCLACPAWKPGLQANILFKQDASKPV